MHYRYNIKGEAIDKAWAADLYRIYKLEPKSSVCISDKDRMRMFYLAYVNQLFWWYELF